MLPSLVLEPPKGEAWIHEIKFDGYRTLLGVDDGEVRAFTRNRFDWSDYYRSIVEAAGGRGVGGRERGDRASSGSGITNIPRGALIRYREWYGAFAPNVGRRLEAGGHCKGDSRARARARQSDLASPTGRCSRRKAGPTATADRPSVSD